MNCPGESSLYDGRYKRSFGVIGRKSSGSELLYVSGRPFSRPVILKSKVRRTSSVGFSEVLFSISNTRYNALFTERTNLSCAPPKCGAAGGWNFQFIPSFWHFYFTFSLNDSASRPFCNSRSAPTKLVPLSECREWSVLFSVDHVEQ